jgi:hypothetical protein
LIIYKLEGGNQTRPAHGPCGEDPHEFLYGAFAPTISQIPGRLLAREISCNLGEAKLAQRIYWEALLCRSQSNRNAQKRKPWDA